MELEPTDSFGALFDGLDVLFAVEVAGPATAYPTENVGGHEAAKFLLKGHTAYVADNKCGSYTKLQQFQLLNMGTDLVNSLVSHGR